MADRTRYENETCDLKENRRAIFAIVSSDEHPVCGNLRQSLRGVTNSHNWGHGAYKHCEQRRRGSHKITHWSHVKMRTIVLGILDMND
jgi:hypothetical protein